MKIKLLTAQEIIDLSDRAYGGDNTARKQLEEFVIKNAKRVNDRIYKLRKAGFNNFYHVSQAKEKMMYFDTAHWRFSQSKKVHATLSAQILEQRALYFRKFLTASTTTLSGAIKYREKLSRAYEKAGFGVLTEDTFDLWTEFTRSEMFKESIEYDSRRIMQLNHKIKRIAYSKEFKEIWEAYKDKGLIDLKEVIDEWEKL